MARMGAAMLMGFVGWTLLSFAVLRLLDSSELSAMIVVATVTGVGLLMGAFPVARRPQSHLLSVALGLVGALGLHVVLGFGPFFVVLNVRQTGHCEQPLAIRIGGDRPVQAPGPSRSLSAIFRVRNEDLGLTLAEGVGDQARQTPFSYLTQSSSIQDITLDGCRISRISVRDLI